MSLFRKLVLTAALLLGVTASPSLVHAAAAGGSGPRQHPGEQAPAALLGIWQADLAVSTFPGKPPREHFRTVQYTADGKIICNFASLNMDGRTSIGHWTLQLDGLPVYEYLSTGGSMAVAEIRMTKIDEYNFKLTNSAQGKVVATVMWQLSQDGKTLTLTRNPDAPNSTKVVYKRWGAE